MAELATIARPYAEAAFELAREKSNLDGWSGMLALLDAVVRDIRVRACVGDPNLSAQELEGLILGVIGDKLDGLGRNLLQVLIRNRRLAIVPQIRSLYEDLRREHEGILEAIIVSALPIADNQLKELIARLEARHQRKISAQVEIDPQLIGGVKIAIGDKVIDATVRGRLEAMAAALTH
ncbi:MAG: ATP synthase F1 subunit delta [Betaproteobacteria bacterium RIFCSPLOWO2_12_FULL_62_58]|nr:MAG: ATP synthase F1 subunit delta [Betaproteobacteria bacterium RIFCSPLOWO2_12_FULL_62_58]